MGHILNMNAHKSRSADKEERPREGVRTKLLCAFVLTHDHSSKTKKNKQKKKQPWYTFAKTMEAYLMNVHITCALAHLQITITKVTKTGYGKEKTSKTEPCITEYSISLCLICLFFFFLLMCVSLSHTDATNTVNSFARIACVSNWNTKQKCKILKKTESRFSSLHHRWNSFSAYLIHCNSEAVAKQPETTVHHPDKLKINGSRYLCSIETHS